MGMIDENGIFTYAFVNFCGLSNLDVLKNTNSYEKY